MFLWPMTHLSHELYVYGLKSRLIMLVYALMMTSFDMLYLMMHLPRIVYH